MFKKAGLDGPPHELRRAAAARRRRWRRRTATGFLTLNFDWLYWPLFEDERHRAAHARPQEAGLQHAEDGRGASSAWRRRRQTARINKISWTGRWVEPNGAFAAGNVGMLHAHSPAYFFVKGQGPWVNARHAGRRRRRRATGRRRPTTDSASPRARRTPSWPGRFVKHMTGDQQARQFARSRRDAHRQRRRSTRRCWTSCKAQDPLGLRGAADPARAHRQDDAATGRCRNDSRDQGRVLAGAAERVARAARTPRRRSPMPTARRASCRGAGPDVDGPDPMRRARLLARPWRASGWRAGAGWFASAAHAAGARSLAASWRRRW